MRPILVLSPVAAFETRALTRINSRVSPPVRCFTFAGNASEQRIIRQVKDELRDWPFTA